MHGRSQDRPCIGWTCSYTPEELLLAGGFLPSRLTTWEAPEQGGDSPLAATLCPFAHRIFQLGQSGGLQGYNGLVLTFSCDSMRRLADACESRLQPLRLFRLDVPRRFDAMAVDFFRAKLVQLKETLESEIGRRIRDDDLFQAFELTNRTRRLITSIAEHRARHPAAMSFREYQSFCLAAQCRDKEQVNQELAARLDRLQMDIESAGQQRGWKPRLLVWGGPLEDEALAEAVEGAGGLVAADDLCTGTRHFLGQIATAGEPVRLLAERSLQRGACSRMTGADRRAQRLTELALRHRCDGVICHTLKFCDLTQADVPRLKQALEAEGMPVLHLERQSLGEDDGQLKTRIEAFVEMLQNKRSVR